LVITAVVVEGQSVAEVEAAGETPPPVAPNDV